MRELLTEMSAGKLVGRYLHKGVSTQIHRANILFDWID